MQYALSLLALALSVAAQENTQEINVVLSDIGAHQSDYLSYIQDGHVPPSGVLSLYQAISTYTDGSYTSLYSQLDQSAISSYVTGLPWYSSRILPAVAAAETGSSASGGSASQSSASEPSGSSTSGASSASGSGSASSSSQASSSSGSQSGSASASASSGSASSGSASSGSASSGSQSGSASSGSHSGSSSSHSSSSGAGQAALNAYSGENIVYALAPLALALAAPLLL